MFALVFLVTLTGWISAGMREHEEEFRQAWVVTFGPTASPKPPPATYKAWYKQFKKTGIPPAQWLSTLRQGPPGSSLV